jgi:cytochrome c biogenesis protein ResB
MGKILEIVGSLRLTVALILLIAGASVFGTLIEQRKALETVYHSPLFVLLLTLLGVNLIFCTLLRLRLRLSMVGFLTTHIGVLLVLLGAVVGGACGTAGMMQLFVGETGDRFYTKDGTEKELPFALRLNRFSVEYYNFGSLSAVDNEGRIVAEVAPTKGAELTVPGHTIKIIDFVPDFVKDLDSGEVTTRSEVLRNPALLVSVTGGGKVSERWIFAKFPQMAHFHSDRENLPFNLVFQLSIRAYRTDASVLNSAGKELKRQTVEVNLPLSFGGYTFYQASYDEAQHEWSGIQVVRDPGVAVVYAGFGLLTFGVFFTLYAKPYLKKRAGGRGNQNANGNSSLAH